MPSSLARPVDALHRSEHEERDVGVPRLAGDPSVHGAPLLAPLTPALSPLVEPIGREMQETPSGLSESQGVERRTERSERIHTDRSQLILFLALLTVTFGLSQNFMLIANAIPDRQHLGAEYFNIASAIASGRGFADPFASSTGPTAWMPPLFCGLLAALVAVLPSTFVIGQVVAALSNIALAGLGVVIYRAAKQELRHVPAALAVGLYVVWLTLFYRGYFMLSHDVWLVALLGGAFLLAMMRQSSTQRVNPVVWGLLGGLSVLTAPAMTLAWGAVTVQTVLQRPQHWRSVAAAAAIAATVGGPWLIRNAMVFQQFIPTKSNTWFEAYQANDIDDDGIYDSSSFWQHPFNVIDARREFAEKGESKFIAERRRAFVSSVRHRPLEYMSKVKNRILASTVTYRADPSATNGWGDKVRSILYALPALCALLIRRGARRGVGAPTFGPLRTFYVAYLVPYWLVAFYERHLLPITAILILFLSVGVDQLVGFLKGILPTWAARLYPRDSRS